MLHRAARLSVAMVVTKVSRSSGTRDFKKCSCILSDVVHLGVPMLVPCCGNR